MEKPTRSEVLQLCAAAAVVCAAFICKLYAIPNDKDVIWVRTIIYCVLYGFWGVSLYLRMTHPQVRRKTLAISVMMVCWLLLRMVKYLTPDEYIDPRRYMWYIYYLPMLFIPVQALLTALTIGMPDTERLPKITLLIPAAAAALVLLVVTNDIHQLVFAFPPGVDWIDRVYSYGIGYYAVAAYILLIMLAIFITLIVKCRQPISRRLILLPIVPAALLILYAVVYDLNIWWVKNRLGDMPAVYCVLYAAAFELCIRCGLIRSNSAYGMLFRAGGIGAQIADSANTVRLSTAGSAELTAEQIAGAEKDTIFIDKSLRLKSKPIRYGRVFWQEDISELTEAIEDIEENCRNIAEHNRISRANLYARREILALQEKNRVNDLLHMETAGQMELIDRLLTDYARETDSEQSRRLLAGTAVVGAYIKRYGNLLLTGRQTGSCDIRELTRCMEESFMNLELMGAECLCTLPEGLTVQTKDVLRIYRAFELMLEECMFGLESVWVHGRDREGDYCVYIDLVSPSGLPQCAQLADDFFMDEGTERYAFFIRKDGAGT